MRTPDVNLSLQRSLTRPRLEKYLQRSGGDIDTALKLYEENVRLSEAFYTPLQSLEVCFRNHIHHHLTEQYGVDWSDNGKPGFSPGSRQAIDAAKRQLRDELPPPDPNDIVAELKFAFWVGLLGPHYDGSLWRRCLHRAFARRGAKARKVVHGRFNAIRRFRNRVMHHEPIFQRPLQQLHDEMIEAISWICPDTAAWTAHHSRFETVLATHGP